MHNLRMLPSCLTPVPESQDSGSERLAGAPKVWPILSASRTRETQKAGWLLCARCEHMEEQRRRLGLSGPPGLPPHLSPPLPLLSLSSFFSSPALILSGP